MKGGSEGGRREVKRNNESGEKKEKRGKERDADSSVDRITRKMSFTARLLHAKGRRKRLLYCKETRDK